MKGAAEGEALAKESPKTTKVKSRTHPTQPNPTAKPAATGSTIRQMPKAASTDSEKLSLRNAVLAKVNTVFFLHGTPEDSHLKRQDSI